MPERCPICDKEECAHTADEKELVKLRAQVKVLEGAIEGWRKVYAEARTSGQCPHCECGCVACHGCGLGYT